MVFPSGEGTAAKPDTESAAVQESHRIELAQAQAATALSQFVARNMMPAHWDTPPTDQEMANYLVSMGSPQGGPDRDLAYRMNNSMYRYPHIQFDRPMPSGVNRFAALLDADRGMAARLAMGFLQNEFDHVHEPGTPNPGQISFKDLIDYRKTHLGNPIATDLVDYLLNNNMGRGEPNRSRFDAIRNMSPHDGPGNWLNTWGPNADGITVSDLETGQEFVANQIRKNREQEFPSDPLIGGKVGFADLMNLDSVFARAADGQPALDAFHLNRFIQCKCDGQPQPNLDKVANHFSFIVDYAGGSGGKLTYAQLQAAEAKLRGEMTSVEQQRMEKSEERKQLLLSVKPFLE